MWHEQTSDCCALFCDDCRCLVIDIPKLFAKLQKKIEKNHKKPMRLQLINGNDSAFVAFF